MRSGEAFNTVSRGRRYKEPESRGWLILAEGEM